MAVLEITLAVILILLALAILAILLTRWTRYKGNETDVSRYSSEQSAGLLDYEDGRGLQHSYSTESDTSCDDQAPSANSPALSRSSIGDIKSSKATQRPFSSTPGAISGAIGHIMQFSAPIPGATGPIKLSQKTIVQTPGPIVQCAGSSAEASEMTTTESSLGSTPHAITAPPAKPRGLPLVPLMISQRTSTIGPAATVNTSGKITLSPMVIFPGYMDGELTKKSDPRAPILKHGGTSKPKSSQEENKEALKKEILYTDSDKSLMHEAKGIELEKDKIGMEAKVKESDMGMPKRREAQVEERESKIPQGQEPQVKDSEAGIPQGQESQVKESESKIPQGQEPEVKDSEAGIPQEQESQIKESESKIPQGQEPQVKDNESRKPQRQESQVKNKNSEDKGNQDKEKGDAGKNEDAKENDAKKKKGDGKKVKGKGEKEPQAKGKKAEASKEGQGKEKKELQQKEKE